MVCESCNRVTVAVMIDYDRPVIGDPFHCSVVPIGQVFVPAECIMVNIGVAPIDGQHFRARFSARRLVVAGNF